MGIRVLVIEDEANIADYLVRGLREEGYVVEHAADGVAAWDALRAGPWDLVLLDWWLPGQDGLTILRRFRQTDRRTPVLFLTARSGIDDRVRGLDGGADDYLCKPFDYDELLARVRALLRRHDVDATPTLAFRDVVVDLIAGRAERAGQPLDLTAREQALLVYFLRHPGQVLSRTRLYDAVWGAHLDSTSKTLEVHVMDLRRKLESRGDRLIHTLRKRGYLFGETPFPVEADGP